MNNSGFVFNPKYIYTRLRVRWRIQMSSLRLLLLSYKLVADYTLTKTLIVVQLIIKAIQYVTVVRDLNRCVITMKAYYSDNTERGEAEYMLSIHNK